MTKKQCKHSEIIVGLIKNKISVTDALFQLKLLLADLHDSSIDSWIAGELEGYKSEDSIPPYRRVGAPLYGRLQQVGFGNIIERTINIPVKIDKLDILKMELRDNISTIEKWAQEKPENMNIPVDLRVANHVADIELNDFCQITNAWHPLPSSVYTEILNAVKSRILDVLLELEEKYGNLDDLSVAIGDEKEKQQSVQIINNIIYRDDSVSIGDRNKVKSSIIGKKNERKTRK